ncbi:MAG: hypothetical protein ABI981_05630 [Betaproteobacteria bacterium]
MAIKPVGAKDETFGVVSATGAGGSSYNRAGASTAGPEGNAHIGGGSRPILGAARACRY